MDAVKPYSAKQAASRELSIPVPMPADEAAEKALIGCVLDGAEQSAYELGVTQDFFSNPDAKRIWTVIDKLHCENQPINLNTVKSEMDGGGMYLVDALDSAGLPSNFRYYFDKANDVRWRRKAVFKLIETAECLNDKSIELDEAINKCQSTFFALSNSQCDLKDQVQMWDEAGRLIESAYGKGLPDGGLKTGLLPVDRILRGFAPGSMNIIASRPGMGKTSLAVQIAINAAKRGKKVAYYSLEMPSFQIINRCLSCFSGLDINHYLETGIIQDKTALAKALVTLPKLGIHIEDNVNKNINQIWSESRRLVREQETDLFIIDYMQLISPTKQRDNRVLEVSEISRSIKKAAMETGKPFLVLAQMNRAIEERGKDAEPRLADLRESGSLEQDADTVSFISKGNTSDMDHVRLMVKKNRHGSIGTANLNWTRFNNRYRTYGEQIEETDKPLI